MLGILTALILLVETCVVSIVPVQSGIAVGLKFPDPNMQPQEILPFSLI